MKRKLKTLILGGLVAGSLVMSAVPVMARDWHWYDRNHRWDDRARYYETWGHRGDDRGRYDSRYDNSRYDRGWGWGRGWGGNDNSGWYDPEWGRLRGSRGDYEDLQQARQQALYDASHHASRKKIAQDDARVDDILNRMGYRR